MLVAPVPTADRACARAATHNLLPPRSKMGLGDKLFFADLAMPAGAALHRVDPALPILKVAK